MALAVVPFWGVLPVASVNVVVDSLGVGMTEFVAVASGERVGYTVPLVRRNHVGLVVRGGSGVFGHVRELIGRQGF